MAPSLSLPSPLVRTLLRMTASLYKKSPFLATIVPTIGLAFGIQGAFAVPSILARSERFYDASGSLTYLSCTALSLALPALRAKYGVAGDGVGVGARGAAQWPGFKAAVQLALKTGVVPGGIWNWRMLFLSAAAGVWAVRLGSFLFARILQQGEDSRFAKIRDHPGRFLFAWMAQATWVSLVLMPVMSVNALPMGAVHATAGFGVLDALGVLLYFGGFGFEATADAQKTRWARERAEKKHSEQFLTRGLWSKSRHPNYFGEATLWTGVATIAVSALTHPSSLAGIGLPAGIIGYVAALGMAGISPAFTTFLLLKVSGVPMSEKKYDRKFKGNKAYEKWRAETPRFFPKL